MRRSFEVLVLGAGPAGCVLAGRLSEERDVCLVEAGPDYGPFERGGWPEDMASALGLPDSHDWKDERGSLGMARIVGGCSAHNACALAVGAAADYDAWPGLSWAELEPCVERALGTLAIRRFERDELTPWSRGLLEAAAEIGFPVHPDMNAPDAIEGIGGLPFNIRGTTRWNAAFAWLDPARGRRSLTILDRALVDRIVIEGGRARGAVVRAGDEELVLAAGLVVLCAGAYGSPAALLRSGVGPPHELERHGIPVQAPLPVGERLHEHFGVPLRFAPSERMNDLLREHAEREPVWLCQLLAKARAPHSPPGLWDVHLLPAVFGDVLSSSSMVLHPEWTGTVRLRSRDPEQLPLVSELSLESDRDLETALEGVGLGRRLARSRALGELVGEELAPGEGATPDELRARGREGLTSYFHPHGSCPMGDVVDPECRVRGVADLRVVDASVIPEPLRANTNLTVLSLAERAAERLLGASRPGRSGTAGPAGAGD